MKLFSTLTNAAQTLPTLAEDIRDIRGPVPLVNLWPWIIAGLVAAAFLTSLILFHRKRRRLATIPRNRLPHEIALEKLQYAQLLIDPGHVREFSIAVSDAVRSYIEDRFQVRAAHHTTEEFLRDLISSRESPLHRYSQSLKDFLDFCDLAKFARWSLSVPQMQSMHASALRLVEETIPRPAGGDGQPGAGFPQR